MGFFSWKTSDTKKSIWNYHSGRKLITVHMITEDGKVFTESEYGGYGVFGGKDIYELIAEMNGFTMEKAPKKSMFDDGTVKQAKRNFAINLCCNSFITNGKEKFHSGGIDFFNWGEEKIYEGKSANQLVEEGWKKFEYMSWDEAAKGGVKLPKLVERLPSKEEWKKVWDKLPYPKNCPNQGYF